MSYIVIHSSKLVIDVNKDVDYLEEDEEYALDEIIDSTPDSIEGGVAGTKIVDLTIRDIRTLFTTYDIVCKIVGLDVDKLLIYWMTAKNIDFEIEDSIDIEEFKRNGYNIIRFKAEE